MQPVKLINRQVPWCCVQCNSYTLATVIVMYLFAVLNDSLLSFHCECNTVNMHFSHTEECFPSDVVPQMRSVDVCIRNNPEYSFKLYFFPLRKSQISVSPCVVSEVLWTVCVFILLLNGFIAFLYSCIDI